MPPVYFPVYIYTFVCMYFSVRCIFSVKNCESWTWHVGLFWTTMERAQWMCSAIQKLLHLRNQTLRPNSIHTLMQEVCLSSLATVAVILATSSTLKTVLCQKLSYFNPLFIIPLITGKNCKKPCMFFRKFPFLRKNINGFTGEIFFSHKKH